MTAHHPVPNHIWSEAAAVLTNFILVEADAMARLVGFGWRATPDAPSDFTGLCEAYAHSERTGEPLPVCCDHSHSTIYLTSEANVAFRFWHDVTHVRLDQSFHPFDEVAVAAAQLQILEAKGWGPDTWVYHLLRADTFGQTVYGARTGSFPDDQAAFARTDLERGLEQAVRTTHETNGIPDLVLRDGAGVRTCVPGPRYATFRGGPVDYRWVHRKADLPLVRANGGAAGGSGNVSSGPGGTRREQPDDDGGVTDPVHGDGRGGTRREASTPTPDGGRTRREVPGANGNGTRREGEGDNGEPYVSVKLPPKLAARFRIVEEFPTQGNEATVMLVEDIDSGERRVLKLYHRGIELRPDAVRKVLDASRDNGHVVTIHEIDQEQGRWYEVQEYCPLGSLNIVLAREDISPVDPTELAAQLIRAVACLEALGLYHRDLKPQNILVRKLAPLDVVVADFGLARDAEAGSQLRTVGGTVAYQPPEAAFDHVSAAYDWFSVAMILAEVALGLHPLATPDGQLPAPGAIRELLNRHPVDVSAIGDERFQFLLRGLLHRQPEHRWQGEQATAWLAGETPEFTPDVDGFATAATASVRFNGAAYHDPDALAAALQDSWDSAIKRLFQQRDPEWIDELCAFLEAHDRKDAARRIADRPTDAASIPALLAEFLIELDPDLRPLFDGIRLTPAGLQEEAQATVRGHGAPRKLDQVRASGALLTWTSLPGMDAFPGGKTAAQLHDLWQSYCDQLDELTAALPRRDDTPTGQVLENARAQLLLCAIDARHHDQLRRLLVPRRTRTERQVLWWRHLATQAGTSPAAAVLATLLQAPAREAAEAAKPKPAPKQKSGRARSARGTLTFAAQGRWLTLWFSALWAALLLGQLWLIGQFRNELLMFLVRRSNETFEERPHVLSVDDLTLVLDKTPWLVALAVGFLMVQILGMWLRDEKLPAAKARMWVLVASLIQLATTLAVAACAAFMILLAYVSLKAEEFGYGLDYVSDWLWWGWLVGAGGLLAALPVTWDALRRFLLALSGGQVTRV